MQSFQGKTKGVPNRLYATVFMIKVAQGICLYTSILILRDLRLFDVGRVRLPFVKKEITE